MMFFWPKLPQASLFSLLWRLRVTPKVYRDFSPAFPPSAEAFIEHNGIGCCEKACPILLQPLPTHAGSIDMIKRIHISDFKSCNLNIPIYLKAISQNAGRLTLIIKAHY